ncbi:molecular chaperone HscC [Sphingomonas sp. AR_OL41]|uniref:Hsp70 family protein n=1 Tax=Sphingomonas sp. AR_OL41 TaxID=3042729 RepID=UPI00247FB8B5|nr:molecular chaperone HscC [Sphingomonas sp. AR_OL41]MDH7973330.1 molecular chaperone HscC [Sphingomonas sp. AR_OL41]
MIIGIDLGTTNSAVSVWRDGRAELVRNSLGDVLTPSAVSIDDKGNVLVGLAARDRQASHPHATAVTFKRLMGASKQLMLDHRPFDAEQLSALVLGSLAADVAALLGEPVSEAVITVPAYFNDRQRKATQRAGELAGLKVRRLLNEPTAAALAYGLQDRGEKEPFLIFDLGGGTFDVSIVEIFDGIIEVRASAGDNRLGGEDFNDIVIDLARQQLDDALLRSIDALRRQELLRGAAERARRALTDADSATFTITAGEEQTSAVITADAFEQAAEPLLTRLRDPVLRSLRDSNIRAEDLSEIVLVGGSTRMPVVRRAITRMFGRFPNMTVNPDEAVALGAGVQAGLLSRDAALDEIRLSDVCPFTLGVEVNEQDARGVVRGGIFSPIIERNTPIPASRVRRYSNAQDNQTTITLNIFQGEARLVEGNVRLGSLPMAVPPRPRGHVAVDCRFSYDTSGLLEVDVEIVGTGMKQNLVIVDEVYAPSEIELAERRAALAALKVHPRDESANAALMARATRCYESFVGERREMIGHWIGTFESALDQQEPRAIAKLRDELTAALDQLEGERYL